MNNKSKDLVVLQWLVISLNEEMNEIHETWQSSVTEGNFATQAERFHAIGNVMTVAKLGIFGQLAYLLERACRAFDEGKLPVNLAPKVFYASKLLYSEVNRHVLTGVDESLLTSLRVRYMQELLHKVDGSGHTLTDMATYDEFSRRIVIGEHKEMALSPEDRKKLGGAWRHGSQKLLVINKNSGESLQMLAKVAHYAMLSTKSHTSKSLWKVTYLWLNSLALNNFPLPHQYAYLLSELDRVLALGANDDSLDTTVWLENLLIDLYIQLSGLGVQSEETHEFLASLNYRLSSEALFFPHILGMLEGMLFALSRGEMVDGVLQEVKEQLGGRGWTFYESYTEQILNDLNLSKDNPETFAQAQWQINTQIQDLYAAISHTHESIQSKIGEGIASKPSVDFQELPTELRRVRMLIETVKTSFDDYLHVKNPSVLAGADVFGELDRVFGEMAMDAVVKVVKVLNQLFATIKTTPPTHISWRFAHSTAECLSLLELFLDGLAKQVFDNALLVKAQESADKATIALMHADEQDEYQSDAPSADVVRYADTGEVAPSDSPSQQTTRPQETNIAKQVANTAKAMPLVAGVADQVSDDNESMTKADEVADFEDEVADVEVVEIADDITINESTADNVEIDDVEITNINAVEIDEIEIDEVEVATIDDVEIDEIENTTETLVAQTALPVGGVEVDFDDDVVKVVDDTDQAIFDDELIDAPVTADVADESVILDGDVIDVVDADFEDDVIDIDEPKFDDEIIEIASFDDDVVEVADVEPVVFDGDVIDVVTTELDDDIIDVADDPVVEIATFDSDSDPVADTDGVFDAGLDDVLVVDDSLDDDIIADDVVIAKISDIEDTASIDEIDDVVAVQAVEVVGEIDNQLDDDIVIDEVKEIDETISIDKTQATEIIDEVSEIDNQPADIVDDIVIDEVSEIDESNTQLDDTIISDESTQDEQNQALTPIAVADTETKAVPERAEPSRAVSATPSQAYLEAQSALKPDDFDFDEDIREIFVEEADEVLETLGELMPSWQANPANLVPLKDIRRGFHTLKGSGRMVGAFSVGEMAWAVENMLNRVLDGTVPSNHTVSDFVAETATLIPTLVQDFANKVPPSIDPANVVLKANNILARREDINEGVFYAGVPADEQGDVVVDTAVQDDIQDRAVVEDDDNIVADKIGSDESTDDVVTDEIDTVQDDIVIDESADDIIFDDVQDDVEQNLATSLVADEFVQDEIMDEVTSDDVIFDDVEDNIINTDNTDESVNEYVADDIALDDLQNDAVQTVDEVVFDDVQDEIIINESADDIIFDDVQDETGDEIAIDENTDDIVFDDVVTDEIDTVQDEIIIDESADDIIFDDVQEEVTLDNLQHDAVQTADEVVFDDVQDEIIIDESADDIIFDDVQDDVEQNLATSLVADEFVQDEIMDEVASDDVIFDDVEDDIINDDDVDNDVQESIVVDEVGQDKIIDNVQTSLVDDGEDEPTTQTKVADIVAGLDDYDAEFDQYLPDEIIYDDVPDVEPQALVETSFAQDESFDGDVAELVGDFDEELVQEELVQEISAKDEPAQTDGDHQAPTALALPSVLVPFMETARQPVASQVDAVDDDIKEIFIEEASEVLETIIPLFEEWTGSRDKATLTDVRRGFHTLKGSGRMVGAVTLGELAWSIENMLNRVLDATVEVDDGMIALIGDVLDSFGGLVKRFEENDDTYPDELYLWVASAHAYSKGHGKEFDYRTLKAGVATDDTAQKEDKDTDKDGVKTNDKADNKADHDGEKSEISLESIEEAAQSLAQAELIAPTNEEEKMFCDVFVDEAKGLLVVVKDFLDDNIGEDSVPVPDSVVRVFHTLRSATGLAPLARVGEMGAMIERGLQHFQRHDEPLNTRQLQSLGSSVEVIEQHLTAYENIIQGNTELATEQLSKVQSGQALVDELVGEDGEKEIEVSSLIEGIDELLDAELDLESICGQTPDVVADYAQKVLSQIEILDARTTNMPKFQRLLLTLNASYQVLARHPEQGQNDEFIDGILQAQGELTGLFDSMAGSMSLRLDERALSMLDAKIQDIQEYYRAIDDHSLVQKDGDTKAKADDEPKDGADGDVQAQDDKAQDNTPEQVELARFQDIETEPELLEIFLEEASELDSAIGESFGAWRDDTKNLDALKALQRHLHTVKGGARLAGISSIGDLTHEAETIYERMVDGRLTPSHGWVQVMQGVQDLLSLQLEEVKTNKRSFFADGAVAKLQKFLEAGEVPEGERIAPPVLEVETQATADVVAVPEEAPKPTEISDFEHRQLRSWHGNLPDEAILGVFLEEAEELVETSSEDFQTFRSNTGDVAVLQVLQRKLHTIKGGARMVTANGLADLAHNMETVYEDLATRRRPATRMVIGLLMACHDFMTGAIVLLKSNLNPPAPLPLINALEGFSKNPDSLTEVPVVSLTEELEAIKAHELAEKQSRGGRDISRMPPAMGMFELTEESNTNNEMIRISANLMERMINLSGEAAINRARIDMTISGLTSSVEEMGVTVQRLHDQLRRMDVELEAQIMAQIDDKTLFEDGDFDPLEMDQYSSLNQLSKSLSESASDLLDLKATLLEKTRDGENLLLQLSRTQTELQDGLMYSRMVPFSRLTPRLQRIVRQVSTELGKQVELTVVNADDEMDRTILERITSPLEHMLRNAIDHGIEMPNDREVLGKPRMGTIVLEVTREGSEILVHLTDDGAGINVEAVRKKAISQGLISADDTSLSDLDIMQYIFNAGLSTTSVITQISGRGVGMDVVRSEIRQLGGSVSVDSERGKGSRFTMRVPLTVAVSDTLVVRAADRQYAVPLVQIDRVTQVPTAQLLDYYRSTNATMMIDGVPHRLRYLNEILSGHNLNDMAGTQTLPVILIKNQTGQNLALQVDEIIGSRIEVVVKPLGRQLSHVSGISAATIMGDGSVMFILDLMALIRNARARVVVEEPAKEENKRPVILVVDDSVTVRKVTSRFLERQGFEAVVAKDGVDALEILQELTPDLMLLDIEMPRMDGFEVATQVRHNSRLKDLPIIMITSRTGEKHRERAFEIGVTDYMGKPFQENELLNRINTHMVQ